jgi:S-adenosylmethionine synthetase
VRKVVATPAGMINHLKLRTPIYAKTAAYGDFVDLFAWECVDDGDELRAK